MIQSTSISQTEALVAHYRSSSKAARRNFVRWIISTEIEESNANTIKDTEKVFRAVSRGLKSADNLPVMDIDDAEDFLKSL